LPSTHIVESLFRIVILSYRQTDAIPNSRTHALVGYLSAVREKGKLWRSSPCFYCTCSQFDEERSKICGSPNNRKKSLSDLREHLQTALLIELYTIPPYLTALFSLKQEKFKHAAEVLKT